MKSLIYCISILVFIISCKSKKINQDINITETKPFSKRNYYKYTYPRNVSYYIDNGRQKLDSFYPIIYTIVEPFEENKNLPKKIYALPFDVKRWKKSVDYFKKELKGKNLSYIEKDNKIIIREFYTDYKTDSTNNVNKITNINELKKYLKDKKLSYNIMKIKKVASTDVVDIDIENKFYKIILNKNLCPSYLFYNKKDTINYNIYSNILASFYQ